MPAELLILSGFDPKGTSGILRDAAVAAALGFPFRAVPTVLTAQSPREVKAVAPVPIHLLRAAIEALCREVTFAAVKVGLLGDVPQIRYLARTLATLERPLVLDPVMWASTGEELLHPAARRELRRLLPIATVVTPNVREAGEIAGIPIQSARDVPAAARRILEEGARAVLIKGGHLPGPSRDYLAWDGGTRWFRGARLQAGRRARGLGCHLSTALAVNLARGASLPEATVRARSDVCRSLRRAKPR